MDNPYASSELFHFVGRSNPTNDAKNYEILSSVLTGGCVSHPPHENSWGKERYTSDVDGDLLTESLIMPDVTCYADIPLNSLGIHLKKYGKFGVSFPRNLLAKYGARPVTYIPLRRDDWASPYGVTMLRDVEAIFKGYKKHLRQSLRPVNESKKRTLKSEPKSADEAIEAVCDVFEKDFLAFLKPFNSHLRENDPDNYYMEREWRKFGNLKFEVNDVSRVVVGRDFVERLLRDFPQFSDRVVEV